MILPISLHIQKMISFVKNFVQSFSFYSGILKTIAILLCIGLGFIAGFPKMGIIGAITIIMISPSDIPGNRKHHFLGIIIATICVAISLLCIDLTKNNLFLLIPTIAILIFGYAYCSLYGIRASMISIAGIFSISLSFAQERTIEETFYSLIAVFLAGILYIILLQILLWIKPRYYSEQLLGRCMYDIAQFFKARATLLTENHSENIQKELLNLQSKINESFEKLREILLHQSSQSSKSNYTQRQILILIELVDIFEYAITSPIPKSFLNESQSNVSLLNSYISFLKKNASILEALSLYIQKRKKKNNYSDIDTIYKNVKENHFFIDKSIGISTKNTNDTYLIKNLSQYIEQQNQKIQKILYIFRNYYTKEVIPQKEKSVKSFFDAPNYSIKRLIDHLSLESPILRHAIRLTIISVIGFLVGYYIPLQNSYWILFTIYVIMRPGYATTKERSKQRIIGTFIGACITALIILICQYIFDFEQYKMIYGVIIVLCMPFAYGLLQEHFSISVVFITIYILLIYTIFSVNSWEVLQYRIIDTAIGVGLSLFANYCILPSWEYKNYHTLVKNALKNTIIYMEKISILYENNSKISTPYKLARKNVFLSIANLNSGLQRMLQEPKSKQKNYEKYTTYLVLQQDFLSVLSSFVIQKSTFNTPIPHAVLQSIFEEIKIYLNDSILHLENQQIPKKDSIQIDSSIKNIFSQLQNIENTTNDNIMFYKEQFLYLYTIAKKINNILTKE